MYIFLVLLSLLSVFTARVAAQDTTYYQQDDHEVASFSKCDYFKVSVSDKADSLKTVETKFSKAGIKLEEAHFCKKRMEAEGEIHTVLEGRERIWYMSGRIKSQGHYVDGKQDGQLITYWENGKIKRNDLFALGVFLTGKCYDSSGAEIPHFPYEVPASFPGGNEAFMKYIERHISFPASSRNAGTGGRVKVQFVVEPDGTVSNIRILKAAARDLGIEVARIVCRMPKWKPGELDGEPTRMYFILPVDFTVE